jgi:hypothetical protein
LSVNGTCSRIGLAELELCRHSFYVYSPIKRADASAKRMSEYEVPVDPY